VKAQAAAAIGPMIASSRSTAWMFTPMARIEKISRRSVGRNTSQPEMYHV
jgi:hypothetical protein